jgi:hypothetical protein
MFCGTLRTHETLFEKHWHRRYCVSLRAGLFGVQTPSLTRDFSFSTFDADQFRDQPNFLLYGYQQSFLGGMQPGYSVNPPPPHTHTHTHAHTHTHTPSAKVKNHYNYNSDPWTGIVQSVLRPATDRTVQRSNPGGGEIFRTRPKKFWDPLGLLPWGNAVGAWR